MVLAALLKLTITRNLEKVNESVLIASVRIGIDLYILSAAVFVWIDRVDLSIATQAAPFQASTLKYTTVIPTAELISR